MIKRLSISVAAGAAITSLPWLLSRVDALWPTFFLTYPGAFVAWEISGDIHNYNHAILVVANIAFYSLFVYCCWIYFTAKSDY